MLNGGVLPPGLTPIMTGAARLPFSRFVDRAGEHLNGPRRSDLVGACANRPVPVLSDVDRAVPALTCATRRADMTTMTPEPGSVTGGVDTHLDVHVAAAVNHLGGVLGTKSFPTRLPATGGCCAGCGRSVR